MPDRFTINPKITDLLTLLILAAMSFSLESCENDKFPVNHLELFSDQTFYESEIIPANLLQFYGKWRVEAISGGITGAGFKNTFEILEVKKFGIYEILSDNKLVERGRIVIVYFDPDSPLLQVRFEPIAPTKVSLLLSNPKYVAFPDDMSMDLIAPCCDNFNFHFESLK